jgi:hypothetical protein
MKWRDVDYLCDGLEAEVIADVGPSDSPCVRSHHGTIVCGPDDALPKLRVQGGQLMAFHEAIVLIVPPRSKR